MADTTILVEIKSDGRGAKVIKRDLDEITKKSEKTQTAIGGLRRAFGLLGGAMVALSTIRTADNMTLLTARIKQSTRSAQEFTLAFNGLTKSSRETGASLNAAVDIFQRLSFSRDEINATAQEMVNFTSIVQKLGVSSGASTEALQAGLTQLGQGLSAGILRAEEFNSILENIPAVGKQIADEFGVTVGQLRNLVLEGVVLSEDVFSAILNSQEKVNEQFEKMPLTFGRAFNQLKQDLSLTIAGFNDLTGASSVFATVIQRTGSVVLGVGNVFKSVFGTIKLIMSSTAAAVFGIIENILSAINFVTEKLNKLTGANIGRIEAQDTFESLRVASMQSATQSGDEIMAGLVGAGGNVVDVFAGRQQSPTGTQETAIRTLSQDYAELAKGLSGADKETKKLKSSTDAYGAILGQISELERERANEIGDMLFDIGRGYTSLRDVAVSALEDILRSMMRLSMGGNAGSGLFEQIGGSIFDFIMPSVGSQALSAAGGASKIGVKPTGFATGGSFTVGGSGSTDSQLVQFMATPGEQVNVRRNGQKNDTDGGGGVTYNIDARGADAGVEQRVMNALRKVERDIPRTAVSAVQNANNRNLGFLR